MLEELGDQTRQIEAMLSQMSQGLCMVDENGYIRGEASAYFWELFPSKERQAFHVIDQIFENSSLTRDEIDLIRSLLSISVGEASFNFEMNSENLPTHFSKEIEGNLHYFECDWSIITDKDQNIVQSILSHIS